MTKMYDPNDLASRGPQVTARPGTKRHLRQLTARTTFLAINHVYARAETKRAQAKLDEFTTEFLTNNPTVGTA